MRVGAPEPFERAVARERIRDTRPDDEQPVERRRQVVVLALETIQPVGLDPARRAPSRLRVRGSRKRSAWRPRSSSSDLPARRRSSACSRTVSSIERRTSPSLASLRTRLQPTSASRSGRKRRLRGATARASASAALSPKTASAPWSVPLLVGQAAVAPVDRGAQRALALGQVDRAFHLERKPFARARARSPRAGARRAALRRARSRAGARRVGGRSRGPNRSASAWSTTPRAAASSTNSVVASSIESGSSGKHVLGREAERRTARGENLQIRARGRGATRRGRPRARGARGCRGRGARRFRSAGPRSPSSSGWPPDSRTPMRAGDRARNEIRLRDRGQPDEVDGALHRRTRRHLERESALPCAAGACDRDESSVAREQRFDAARARRSPDRRW